MEEETTNDKDMETESSSSSSDDEENELEARAEELERQVSQNEYLYDAHVELVELYRKLSDLNSMRSAYERFHKNFPLTPTLWLAWIQDEIKLAQSPAENKKIFELFDKAVEDYQSVKLWQEYAQFAIGSCSIPEVRAILERGLNSVGLHVAEGSLLWDTLREFELAHLAITESNSEQFQTQLVQVVEVFRRQLSVPLLDMETTHEEWQNFLKQLPDDHGIDLQPIDWGYKKALKLLETYKPFEQRLEDTEDDFALHPIYKEYIKAIQDPSLILSVYERAVAQLCLNPALWEEYCAYALKLGEIALKVNGRSLRNCPWSPQLWVMRLRFLERFGRPDKEVLACFEEAVKVIPVSQALDLWLAYIEYVKRNSEDVERLNKVFEQAKEQLGFDNDQSCKVPRLHARFLSAQGNMTSARKIWAEVMKIPSSKSCATMWMDYLRLERHHGEAKQVRNVFQRAISNCSDWQEYFAEEWLMFEREVGSLQDVINCAEKCKNYIQSTSNGQYQQKLSIAPSTNIKKRYADGDETNNTKHKKQKTFDNRTESKGSKKLEKMETEPARNATQGPPANLDTAKTVFVSNLSSKVDEDKLRELFSNSVQITIPKRKGVSRCFAYVQFGSDSETREALKRDREPLDGRPIFISECKPDRAQRQPVFKYANKVEYNKLFARGLPRHYTQEEVANIFKPYGATDVRLVYKFNGQFKGFAYIDFANDEDAEKAMKNTNEMTIGENKINVAISAPPDKKKEVVAPAKLPARNSKSRLDIAFVPRSVQVKKNAEENVAKTNDDFRKLLINRDNNMV